VNIRRIAVSVWAVIFLFAGISKPFELPEKFSTLRQGGCLLQDALGNEEYGFSVLKKTYYY